MSDFYSQLSRTGVRLTHQFQMSIQSVFNVREFENITLWTESFNLPGRTVDPIEIPYFGYKFKVPGVVQMTQELNLSVRCDAGNSIRDAFLTWQKLHSSISADFGSAGIGSLDNNSGGGNKRIPQTTVTLDMLDETMQEVTQKYILFGAWPSNIGEITFSHENPDVAKFDVTLAFQYFTYTAEIDMSSLES